MQCCKAVSTTALCVVLPRKSWRRRPAVCTHPGCNAAQREAFQRLQAAIFAGKITTVVVWKLDRLAHSLKDGVNVLADWCQ